MTAAAMTYESLVSDIVAYAERTDTTFTAQVPRLIMLAEDWLSREVKGLGRWKVSEGALAAATPTLVKPERWRETGYMKITGGGATTFVKKRDLTYCQQFWPETAQVDRPMFYAEYDYDYFLIVATPDIAYDLELGYYQKPEPLCEENQSNWLTENAPTTILYASLAEAQMFLKNTDKVSDLRSTALAAVSQVVQEQRARSSDNAANKPE